MMRMNDFESGLCRRKIRNVKVQVRSFEGTGWLRLKAGDRRQKAGGRRQEARGRRQKAGGRGQFELMGSCGAQPLSIAPHLLFVLA